MARTSGVGLLCETGCVEIMGEEQHRVLAFVAAANAGGYRPSDEEVALWLEAPAPADSSFSILASVRPLRMDRLLGFAGESLVEHLVRIRWLQRMGPGVEVTTLGRSLLRWAVTESPDSARVVTLDHGNPLAYAVLVGELASAGRATLVDPYFDANGLVDISRNTEIDRVLVGDKDPRKRASLATLLSADQGLGVDVRSHAELHDRLVVADDGRVWTLGASLNTVSRRTASTIMTPLPSQAAEAMGEAVRTWWEGGESLLMEDNPDEESPE